MRIEDKRSKVQLGGVYAPGEKKGRAALEGLCFLHYTTLLDSMAALLNKTHPFVTVGLR